MATEFHGNKQTWSGLHSKLQNTFVRFESKFDFLDRFSQKSAKIKFHGHPSGGSLADTCGQTDGHGAATRRLSRLNESARNSPHRLQSFNQSQYSSILWTDLWGSSPSSKKLAARLHLQPRVASSQPHTCISTARLQSSLCFWGSGIKTLRAFLVSRDTQISPC